MLGRAVIWALRNWRLVLAGALVLAVPVALWAIWHAAGDAREAGDRPRQEFQLVEAVDLLVGRLLDDGAVAVDKEDFFHGWGT